MHRILLTTVAPPAVLSENYKAFEQHIGFKQSDKEAMLHMDQVRLDESRLNDLFFQFMYLIGMYFIYFIIPALSCTVLLYCFGMLMIFQLFPCISMYYRVFLGIVFI